MIARAGLCMSAMALLLLGGCGPAAGQRSADAPATTSEATRITAAEYERRTAMVDQFQIQTGRMALQKSDREDVRALGRLLVDDHIRSTRRLREAVGDNLESPAPPLDSSYQDKLRDLQSLQGQEFNRRFLETQRALHEEALALHRAYARDGDDAALRMAAGEFAALAQKHFDEIERIRGTRSAPPPRG